MFPQRARELNREGSGGDGTYLKMAPGDIACLQIERVGELYDKDGNDGGKFTSQQMDVVVFWHRDKLKRDYPDVELINQWTPAVDSGHLDGLFKLIDDLTEKTGNPKCGLRKPLVVSVEKVGRYNKHSYRWADASDGVNVGAAAPTGPAAAPARTAPVAGPAAGPSRGPAAGPARQSAVSFDQTFDQALGQISHWPALEAKVKELWPQASAAQATAACVPLVAKHKVRVALAMIAASTNDTELGDAWNHFGAKIPPDGKAAVEQAFFDQQDAIAAGTVAGGEADIPF